MELTLKPGFALSQSTKALGWIAGFVLSAAICPAEDITVTVTSYVRTNPSHPDGLKFHGFGVNGLGYGFLTENQALPQALRAKCARTFWKDLDMRGLRIWSPNYNLHLTVDQMVKKMYDEGNQYLEDVKAEQPNPLELIFAWDADLSSPTDPLRSWSQMTTDDVLRNRIQIYADLIQGLYDKYGWKMNYVEITNEPEGYWAEGGWSNPSLWGKALTMTRIWRQELDQRGFQDVKVLAASRSGVGVEAAQMIDSFKVDLASLSAWGGYSFHSYGMGMRKELMDKLEGVDVDIVQTESGAAFRHRGIGCAISDINLGTNHWEQFLGYEYNSSFSDDGYGGARNPDFYACHLAGFVNVGTPQVDLVLFNTFYFFRELAKKILVGSKIHFCKTDKTSKSVYENMEITDGPLPPITATAAEQPDGKWALLVFNASDSGISGSSYAPYPQTPMNVTFQVRDLAGSGSQPFTVRKIKPNKEELDLPNQVMQNGSIVVTGLMPGELVTLQSVNQLTNRISVPTPDLVITANSWEPSRPRVGDSVLFLATVSNHGSAATKDGDTIAVLFNVDGVGVAWADQPTSALAVGASRTITVTGGFSNQKFWPAVEGKHTLTSSVNDVKRVAELNYANNGRMDTISVAGLSTGLAAWPANPSLHWYQNSAQELMVQNVQPGARLRLFRLDGMEIRGHELGNGQWRFPAAKLAKGIMMLEQRQGQLVNRYKVTQLD